MSRRTQEVIELFIGSPVDVDPLHQRAIGLVQDINSSRLLDASLRLDAVSWRHNSHSRNARLTPQNAFNHGATPPSKCAACIFIFGKRIGTELAPGSFDVNGAGNKPTGTLWEYHNALESESSPPIWIYRDKRDPSYNPGSDGEIDEFSNQLKGLKSFFDTFKDDQGRGLQSSFEFDSDESFVKQLKSDIEGFAAKLQKSHTPIVNTAFSKDTDNGPLIPALYLQTLRENTAHIEPLGASDAKESLPCSLPEIYVPAITQAPDSPDPFDSADVLSLSQREAPYLVMDRLASDSLYLCGHPGSGKSIFCQWLTHSIANGAVPPSTRIDAQWFNQSSIPQETLPTELSHRLPVLIRLRDLWSTMQCEHGNQHWTKSELEQCLMDWLDSSGPAHLNGAQFKANLDAGNQMLILDGVDEVPEESCTDQIQRYPRNALLTGLAQALPDWRKPGNRILLTSRPYGLTTSQQKRLPMPGVQLLPLNRPLQHLFIHRWYTAADAGVAGQYIDKLITELNKRKELATLRDNPLLLTSICVKFKEGKRLPQDIHHLFDSITNQILYSRFQHSEKQRERIRWRLEAIALGMQQGRDSETPLISPMASAPFEYLRRVLADYGDNNPATEHGAADVQERLNELLEETGLLVSRSDGTAEFYHQNFRDFLAAERWYAIEKPLDDAIKQYANNRDWRRMLGFLFAREIKTSGLDRKILSLDQLPPILKKSAIRHNSNAALLLADCYAIAFGEDCKDHIDSKWAQQLRLTCENALSRIDSPEDLNELYLILGAMGWDTRDGVGVDGNGLPKLHWLPVNTTGDAPFYVSKYLITHQQFQAFVNSGAYEMPEYWQDNKDKDFNPGSPNWIDPTAPRETVNWYEARAFSRWLTQSVQLPIVGGSIDLPTEAEWLHAYTGGENKETPWPGETTAYVHGNFSYEAIKRTSAVGIFPQGLADCGALDMGGNVWEWCVDLYDEKDDKNGPRSLRGGAFDFGAGGLRSATRDSDGPGYRVSDIGFRVVCRPHQ